MSNGKTIRDAMKAAKDTPAKPNPFKHDVIEDPMGQWKYPGQVTKIPSGDITMHGVNYPVLGVDNLGNAQMMFPNQNYQFAGQHVTEYPMPPKQYFNPFVEKNSSTDTHMEMSGWLDELAHGGTPYTPMRLKRKVKQKGTKKNIQSSINELFLRNHPVFGSSGKGVYNPNSKYKLGGWLDNLD